MSSKSVTPPILQILLIVHLSSDFAVSERVYEDKPLHICWSPFDNNSFSLDYDSLHVHKFHRDCMYLFNVPLGITLKEADRECSNIGGDTYKTTLAMLNDTGKGHCMVHEILVHAQEEEGGQKSAWVLNGLFVIDATPVIDKHNLVWKDYFRACSATKNQTFDWCNGTYKSYLCEWKIPKRRKYGDNTSSGSNGNMMQYMSTKLETSGAIPANDDIWVNKPFVHPTSETNFTLCGCKDKPSNSSFKPNMPTGEHLECPHGNQPSIQGHLIVFISVAVLCSVGINISLVVLVCKLLKRENQTPEDSNMLCKDATHEDQDKDISGLHHPQGQVASVAGPDLPLATDLYITMPEAAPELHYSSIGDASLRMASLESNHHYESLALNLVI